ncbi:hypothetical protein [Clostridium sp.]|uniref:hypothetical protein n=1 Tax=Clostridium sp. TaxID=1506 RepID=UPI00283CCA58|nr:hypothetical protein [Clostridium sp.]MDR3597077.1 hypothetical protein [Clostridium sp.]
MLKYHPEFGVYDLSFKAAVKSLIKDGFIDSELIDNLYAESAILYSKEYNVTLEEAKAAIRAKVSPWVWLCRTGTVTCVKLKPYDTDPNGKKLYVYGGCTRTCRINYRFEYPEVIKWRRHCGTLEQIRKFCTQTATDIPFVSICRRNKEGVLELVGYVI